MMKVLAAVLGFLALATVALAQGEIPDCPQPSPGEQGNVTFYPNTEDCHLYWMCDNGNLLNQSCGDELIWNPAVNSCDWDFNVEDSPCLGRRVRSVRRVPSFKRPKPLVHPVKHTSPSTYRFANKYDSSRHAAIKKQTRPAHRPVTKKQIPATKEHLTIRNPTKIKTLPHRRPVPRKPVTFIRH